MAYDGGMSKGIKRIRVPATSPTTRPGFENEHRQVVVCDTGWPSETFPGQRVYKMRCGQCGFAYGSNGTHVKNRRCPDHDGGAKGERLRESGPGLFDGAGLLAITID